MSLVVESSVDGSSVGMPLAAGPIWTRQWDGKTIKINASGIRSILNKRKAHSWVTPYASQTLTYSGLSLGTIASRLVGVAMSGSKPGSTLPITLPADVTDGDATHTRTYFGYELKSIGDTLLSELTGVQNGPDIDFQPVWVDSSRSAISWNMLVGTPIQPQIFSKAQVVFDASSPASSVQQVTYTEDASVMSTTQWSNGSGQDISTLMSQATSTQYTSNGWPLLEVEQDYKSVIDQATLDTHSLGDLNAHLSSTVQWTLTVDGTRAPVLGSYALGDIARVRVKDHYWIPNGEYLMRIVSIDGDSSMSVRLGVQGL
jgi:hypothetical protein